MDTKNLPEENDELSASTHEEQLRIENEILRMKVIAQFGGQTGSTTGLPPEIENKFLKHVIAFEEQYNTGYKSVKISGFLGNPVFRKSEDLNDEEFEQESSRLAVLLQSKGISLDFLRERDNRFQYKFITEELFEHESDFGVSLSGMMHCFIYEEFHPDHEMDIERRTKDFMKAWSERETEFANHYLAHELIQPDEAVLSQDDAIIKLRNLFDSYTAFENFDYKIFEVKFQLHTDIEPQGLGHAEGVVKYEAILESGERKSFTGPFKLYMSLNYEWWSIFYFVMPGFEG